MTVATDLNTVSYTGNGVTTVFPFTFTVLDEDHLAVYERVIATGVNTLLDPAAYTVTGVPGTGSVTYNPGGVPLPSTKKLVLLRTVPLTQDMDIENQGGFFPEVLEDQLDQIVMGLQQVAEEISRAVVTSPGGTGVDADTYLAALEAAAASASASASEASTAEASATAAAASVDYRLVATRTDLKTLNTSASTIAFLKEEGREGVFQWDGDDLSSVMITDSVTSTSVNSGTGVITKADHEWYTGEVVVPTTTVNGLTAGAAYYVIRSTVDTFKLASSWANAIAGTAVTLTGTTNFTLNRLLDPEEGVYVVPTGLALDGSDGAWVRKSNRLLADFWGVIHDGVTDDTQALRAAAHFIGHAGGTLELAPADHLLDTATASDYTARGIGPYNVTFQNTTGWKVVGTPGKTRLRTGVNGNLSVVFFVMNCSDFEISGIDFGGDQTGRTGLTGAAMIYSCKDFWVHDCSTEDFLGSHFVGNFQFNGVYERIRGSIPAGSMFDVASWQNMTVRNVTGIGSGSTGFHHIYDSPNDNPAFNETGIALEDDHSNGIRLVDCDWSAFNTGVAISQCDDVWLVRNKLHDNKPASGDYRGGVAIGGSSTKTLRSIHVIDCEFTGNGSDSGTVHARGGMIVNSNTGDIHISVKGCKFFDNKDVGIVFLGAGVTFEGDGNEFGNIDTSDQLLDWSGTPTLRQVYATGLRTPQTGLATVGSLTLLQGQIAFPAAQNPSAVANTLDDYEEGTFTPGVSFGGASVGVTYSASRSGYYTKIGRVVLVVGNLILTAKGSSTGAALVTGLPFSVSLAATAANVVGWVNMASLSNPGGLFSGSNLVPHNQGAAGVTQLTDVHFTNTSNLYFNGSYIN